MYTTENLLLALRVFNEDKIFIEIDAGFEDRDEKQEDFEKSFEDLTCEVTADINKQTNHLIYLLLFDTDVEAKKFLERVLNKYEYLPNFSVIGV